MANNNDMRRVQILVLEDQEDWQDIIRRTLTEYCVDKHKNDEHQFEYDIYSATSIEEAHNLLKQHHFHIWLLDLSIDEDEVANRAGVAFLEQYRDTGLAQHVAIFVISGYPNKDNMRDTLKDSDGALDFFDKGDFSRDELCDRVRKVLIENPENDRVRINLGLKITYQDKYSSAEDVVVGLRIDDTRIKPTSKDDSEEMTSLRERIADEFEDLLCRLFYTSRSIYVAPISEETQGHSGAGVVIVRPIDEFGVGNYVIVKFGQVDIIGEEYANYRAHVEGIVGFRPTVINRPLGRTTHLAGMVYSFVGVANKQPAPFTKFYQSASTEDITALLEDIFQNLYYNWITQQVLDDINLTDEYLTLTGYTQELVEEGLKRLHKSVIHNLDETLQFTRLSENRPIRNPIRAIENRVFSLPVFKAINHGDLNSDNILLDDENHAWLIDFRNTTPGHSLRDLAKLDSVVRFQLLEEDHASLDERLRLEDTLNQAVTYQDINNLPETMDTDNENLQKAYCICRKLRVLALDQNRRPQEKMNDYYIALVYYALNFIRYFNRPKIQREHALLSAGLLVEKI